MTRSVRRERLAKGRGCVGSPSFRVFNTVLWFLFGFCMYAPFAALMLAEALDRIVEGGIAIGLYLLICSLALWVVPVCAIRKIWLAWLANPWTSEAAALERTRRWDDWW